MWKDALPQAIRPMNPSLLRKDHRTNISKNLNKQDEFIHLLRKVSLI
jgi:hypothetical protein